MAADAHAAADFYGTARGAVAARLLRERLTLLWPDLRGQSVLGIGFSAPYLRLWREEATCVALTPAQMGATRWPAGAPSLSCTAEEDALPFADLMFVRVLLVVAPNRSGMWAYWESTPFGHGQPYSFGQIGRLLAASLYRVERRDTALYLPPSHWRLVLRSGPLCERTGRKWLTGFAGVTITEAVKDLYAAMPVEAVPRRRLVLAEAA